MQEHPLSSSQGSDLPRLQSWGSSWRLGSPRCSQHTLPSLSASWEFSRIHLPSHCSPELSRWPSSCGHGWQTPVTANTSSMTRPLSPVLLPSPFHFCGLSRSSLDLTCELRAPRFYLDNSPLMAGPCCLSTWTDDFCRRERSPLLPVSRPRSRGARPSPTRPDTAPTPPAGRAAAGLRRQLPDLGLRVAAACRGPPAGR